MVLLTARHPKAKPQNMPTQHTERIAVNRRAVNALTVENLPQLTIVILNGNHPYCAQNVLAVEMLGDLPAVPADIHHTDRARNHVIDVVVHVDANVAFPVQSDIVSRVKSIPHLVMFPNGHVTMNAIDDRALEMSGIVNVTEIEKEKGSERGKNKDTIGIALTETGAKVVHVWIAIGISGTGIVVMRLGSNNL